jgi:hypothetical protein
MLYKVVLKNLSSLDIEATRFVADGAGLRMYGADGEMVAEFADGTYSGCYPADATITPPPAPEPAPPVE